MSTGGIKILCIVLVSLVFMHGCTSKNVSVAPPDNTFKLLDHPETFVGKKAALDSITGIAEVSGDRRRSLYAGNNLNVSFNLHGPEKGTWKFSYAPGEKAASYAGDVTIRMYIENSDGEKLIGRWEILRSELPGMKSWQDAAIRWPENAEGAVTLRMEVKGFLDDTPDGVFYIANPRLVPDRAPAEIQRIIVIGITALRADHVGAYGYERNTTPALDDIASRGILYRNCYSNSSLTSLSIKSILDNAWLKDLSSRNFSTYSIQHNFPLSDDSDVYPGFDSSRLIHLKPSLQILDEAHKWISTNSDEDTFTFIHLAETGLPFVPPMRYRERFDPEYEGDFKYFYTDNLYEWGGAADYPEDVREHLIALYDEEVAATDASIGWFMDSLESAGLLENALVIITGLTGEELWDHGELGHGHKLYIEQLHVPLVILGRGVASGIIEDKITGVNEIQNILQHWTGFASDDSWDGRFPLPGYSSSFMFVEGNTSQSLIKDGHHIIWSLPEGTEELFNLKDDPGEMINIAPTSPLTEKLRAFGGGNVPWNNE